MNEMLLFQERYLDLNSLHLVITVELLAQIDSVLRYCVKVLSEFKKIKTCAMNMAYLPIRHKETTNQSINKTPGLIYVMSTGDHY